MNPSTITPVLSLPLTFERPILLVGSMEDLIQALPTLSDELPKCEQLHSCGELPSDDPATELWQRITAIEPERIWIVGGDGTINLVGQCALRVDWKLPCWLTPAGTANDLARALADRAAPVNLTVMPENATAIVQPNIDIDLLSVKLDQNPWVRCAANMFTLGTSARNTHHVTTEIKSRWGAFAYLTQIWRAMNDLEPFSVRMSVGDADVRSINNILNIFIANGPYCGGGFRVAPPAEIDDRYFDVLILKQGTTAELAHLATAFLTGNHLEHPLVEHFRARRLRLECEEASPLTLDGEPFNASRIEIAVSPARLPLSLVTSS